MNRYVASAHQVAAETEMVAALAGARASLAKAAVTVVDYLIVAYGWDGEYVSKLIIENIVRAHPRDWNRAYFEAIEVFGTPSVSERAPVTEKEAEVAKKLLMPIFKLIKKFTNKYPNASI